ncbi:MAG TPA: ABC transporter [Cyanobacteria bacterium UBA11149]|nr:ABC transporter [Cyanobacteria bacterium UBA11367]HBE60336.1 ABC transporter [Cyanobacteria bacterium UBA11366]HBK66652.1 ABC transporter [Cyanobacteria bacterium UBA11166]HBR75422.1 ABC transporter [Cyanobacteria bacterium UBA11159]HBS71866.1 ABC transporter [Cyanobacteria bacterium UBA11153]HBW89686.1 ABC transporter [Cyanobacteria bacterium UBA11149]HCA95158.1 ABC transporter [Cyanobacteria bacterium UBA9226]
MIHNNQTLEIETESDLEDPRPTQTRIRIRIPEQYHHEPVISNLISREGLKVNISAAVLGANAKGDGWFNLLLEGSPKQINSALIYLSDLDVEVWQESTSDRDGW